MPTTNLRRWVAGSTVLLGGAVALGAQDPSPSKVHLGFSLEPGRVVKFLCTSETEVIEPAMAAKRKGAGVQESDGATSVRAEFSVVVHKLQPDGNRSATIRFGRIKATIPTLLGRPVEVDSDHPLPEPMITRVKAAEAVGMGGLSLPAVIDRTGTVLEVKVSEDATAYVRKRLGVRDSETGLLQLPLRAERIAGWVNHAWGFAPLPGKEVAAGATWTVSLRSGVEGASALIHFVQSLRVEAMGVDEIRIEGKGVVKPVARDLPKDMLDMMGRLVVGESATSCELRLRPADGLPLSGKGTAKFGFQEFSGKGSPYPLKTVQSTWTTERVAAWPSDEETKPTPPDNGPR